MNRFRLPFVYTCLAIACLAFARPTPPGQTSPQIQTAEVEQVYIPGQPIEEDFKSFAQTFLKNHCIDCHDSDSPEAGLSLSELEPVDEVNIAIWKSVWAQVALKEMPPADADQPEIVERLKFADWIVGELAKALKDKGGFRDHLDPNRANFIDHALLFRPLPKDIQLVPTSSPARIWRVTPQEHITRLNELINKEPDFDPQRPGLRTQGDVVPTNHGGELKMYFGTERITDWQGGTVAYATAVKSLPAVLSSQRKHGLENYPDFYSVNSAQSTQILDVADDIIRYMAEGPLSIAAPEQITDDSRTYEMKGDLRGLPSSLVYNTKQVRPFSPIIELMQGDAIDEEVLRASVDFLFESLTFRPPSSEESETYVAITKKSIQRLGKKKGIVLGLSSIFLDRDALFRPELVENGQPDQHGRVMLQNWELGLAVNHALRIIKPDAKLRTAILEGKMRTRADVDREVQRMLADNTIRKPRILSFFRDYFDYDLGGYICKDEKALKNSGADGITHYRAMFAATASTDRLVELILEEDVEVLMQLLTTDKVVASEQDKLYFGTQLSKQQQEAKGLDPLKLLEKRKAELAAAVKLAENELEEVLEALMDAPDTIAKQKEINRAKRKVTTAEKELKLNKPKDYTVKNAELSGPEIFARVSRRSFGIGSMKPERFLATAPEGERLGILTHPSWLVSHSDAMDNHAIHRGRWIRERLLGGGIPDVPITVDAMLPDEPHKTLRERMRVTTDAYCWTCHKKMDPLGLPFEMFNHAGMYRITELEKPVDTSGAIIDSGDEALDGKVENAIEMIAKLAQSRRAEEVFVRHAFRFWMGRNETLNDAPVLQAAHRAYRDNGGSMNALIRSLLTSDAFLYRTREKKETAKQN